MFDVGRFLVGIVVEELYSRLEAETLLTCGEGEVPLVQPLADRTAGKVELRVNTGKGYLDHGYEERWLKRRMV